MKPTIDAKTAEKNRVANADAALKEAVERHKRSKSSSEKPEIERGGRGGLDPVRYDDWEVNGRAIDF